MIPVPLLWILFVVVLGIVGASAGFLLTQAATSIMMLLVFGLVIMFVVYPIAPAVIKKLRAHAESLECLQVPQEKTDEGKKEV